MSEWRLESVSPKCHVFNGYRISGPTPYRFSRNPLYLAFSMFQLGIASWVNSVWLIATLIAAVALMASVVIPREERYLERRFGADYLDYKRSVRRWL
jgi:protein-S-isoprenylcysteine O-methyltransferase Ste14